MGQANPFTRRHTQAEIILLCGRWQVRIARFPTFLLVMLAAVSTACNLGSQVSSGNSSATSAPTPFVVSATTPPIILTQQILENLDYSMGNARISLVSGKFTGQLPGYPGPGEASLGLTAPGDLNNDGVVDAVAVLFYHTQSTTGHFSYLEAVVLKNGKPSNIANVYLGDREQFQTVTIENGEVVIKLIAHVAGDGGCCPSTAQIWRYRLQGDKWVQTDSNKHI